MPPLPSTFDVSTVNTIEALQRRQKDLADFQIPRLQKCTGPLAVQQNLAGELREDLDGFSRQVEALQLSIGDQSGEWNRRELQRVVDGFKQALNSLRRDTRTALLTSKRAIDAQSVSNRDELLRSSALNEKQAENTRGDDALMRAHKDVTTALRRTMDVMQGELEKSVLSSQLLDESSITLRAASSQHDVLTTVMSTSKQLIKVLEKSDWLDRMLLMAGLLFFFLVVAFILKRRIIDRGIRVAFWWTRFLPSMSTSPTVVNKAADVAVEKAEEGSLSVASVVSTLITTATAAASSAISTSSPELESSSTTSLTEVDSLSSVTSLIPVTTPIITEHEDNAVHDEL